MTENPTISEDLKLTEDVLYECVNHNEIKDCRKHVDNIVRTKAYMRKMCQDRAKRGAKYFKPKHAKSAKRKAPAYKPLPRAPLQAATDFILKYGPDNCECVCDDYNGRYRCFAPMALEWRSHSWSRRGYSACAALCLQTLWDYELRYFGTECPFDLKELVSTLVDPADQEDD